MKAKKLYFKECHLAGRKYYDADEVWDDLKVGTLLKLERDLDNRHDEDAVAVLFEKDINGEREQYMLGYIPSCENEEIAKLLEMGWKQIFECRICKIKPDAHPEDQIHMTIKIKKNFA